VSKSDEGRRSVDGQGAEESSRAWDRLSSESAKAFLAFTVYRDLGPGRSLRAAVRIAPTNLRQLEYWSSKYKWGERAKAWDEHNDRLRQAELEAGVVQMTIDEINLAKVMRTKAAQRIEYLDPDELTVREAVLLADLANKHEHAARRLALDSIAARPSDEVTGLSGTDLMRAIAQHPELADLLDQLDRAVERTSKDSS
jgi:hypothetical protein